MDLDLFDRYMGNYCDVRLSCRYFECAPRFGLFAPLAKVSRSPSNRKPGACAIHSNGRATPLRRSNSRESLTSLGTSIASSRAGVRLGVTSLGAQVG